MKRIVAASAIALAAALIACGSPAHAIDADRFPPVPEAPTWYTAAADAPYATTDATLAAQYAAKEDDDWHASAWWYGPKGGAPSTGQPDIVIETLRKSEGQAGATDPNLIVLSLNAAFPDLTSSLGTEFNTGIVIPEDTSAASPTLIFPGDGIIVAQRPARDCTMKNDQKDDERFTVNLAMLGENQHKYRVNLTVEFGTRTWNIACASSTPVASTQEEPAQGVAEPKKANEVKKVDGDDANVTPATGTTDDTRRVSSASGTSSSNGLLQFVGWAIGLLVLGAVIWVVAAITYARRKREFNNDGTRRRTPQKRDEFGRW